MIKSAIDYPAKCIACEGTGMFRGHPCWSCGGDGIVASNAWVLPTGYFRTCELYDCINGTEYMALVEPAKDGVRIILALGVIYLGPDSKALANWNLIFTGKPITLAATAALIATD